MDARRWDAIVVGSGSSGGIVAARLAEDPARSVLLVEAGPDFPDVETAPPAWLTGGVWSGMVHEVDWGYLSEPLPSGRRLETARGKLVGGSSMVNGTLCVRGRPDDFDGAWPAGWSWTDVEPFYEAVEARIPIRRYERAGWQPVQHAMVDALERLGYRWHDDMNARGAWHGTVGPGPFNRRNEVRQGTLVTYIRDARPLPNFELRPDTLVDRVLLRDGRARGVRAIGPDGRVEALEADLVVLSAGAYGTPSILLRSGIGPPDELARLGIQPQVDLPVGERLLDHAVIAFRFVAPGLCDLCSPHSSAIARDPDNAWLAVARSLDEATGLCAIVFVPCAGGDGSLRLASAEPDAAPRIEHRYDGIDFRPAREAYGELLASPELAGARDLDGQRELAAVVAEGVTTGFHPAGTCGIGRVVDEELRVLGVAGLVVADASVFPEQVSNNTNHTAFMVGERAAALLGAPEPVRIARWPESAAATSTPPTG